MVEKAIVRHAVERMVVVWPMLGNRDQMRREIGEAVMAYADRLEPSDVEIGTTLLIRSSKTAADDGGPAWPPGPNEVIGCILKARADRMEAIAERDAGPVVTGPRRVVGKRCRCGGPVDLLAGEGVLRCDTCRAVLIVEWRDHPRIHLTLEERRTLVFAEPEPVADDAIGKVKEFVARLQQEAAAKAEQSPRRSSALGVAA